MKKKIISLFLISVIFVCSCYTSCFAGVDEVKLFISTDFGSNSYNQKSATLASQTFAKLGYKIRPSGVIIHPTYTVTGLRSDVLSYIHESGDNYAFYVDAHANTGVFTMNQNDNNQCIYPSDITGGWHFVWLNGCKTLSDSSFADAFHTTGYSKRISLGWYLTVYNDAITEWSGYFYNVAGTMGLCDACLEAASHCSNSTPIRLYGDKEWNGYAWP